MCSISEKMSNLLFFFKFFDGVPSRSFTFHRDDNMVVHNNAFATMVTVLTLKIDGIHQKRSETPKWDKIKLYVKVLHNLI